MRIVQADIDSSNTLVIKVMYTFTPAIDPKVNPPPKVYAPLSNLEVVSGSSVVQLVPSEPKSLAPQPSITTEYSASIPTNIDRNGITKVNASGYIKLVQDGTITTMTPTVSASTDGIRIS